MIIKIIDLNFPITWKILLEVNIEMTLQYLSNVASATGRNSFLDFTSVRINSSINNLK
jgi:hypothetical protein